MWFVMIRSQLLDRHVWRRQFASQWEWKLCRNQLRCVLFQRDKIIQTNKGRWRKTVFSVTWPCVPRMRQGNKSVWKTHAPATTGFRVCRFHGDPTRRVAATRGDRGGNAKDGHWPGLDGLATGTTPRHSSAESSVWAGATAYCVLPHFCITKTDAVLSSSYVKWARHYYIIT
jgi:hypothetical protein